MPDTWIVTDENGTEVTRIQADSKEQAQNELIEYAQATDAPDGTVWYYARESDSGS